MKFNLTVTDPDNNLWKYKGELNHIEEVSVRINDILVKPRTDFKKLNIVVEKKNA